MSRSAKRCEVAVSRGLCLALCAAALLLIVRPAQAQFVLTHHVRQAVISGQAQFLGPLPAAQSMRLDVVLPLRDSAGLKQFLQTLYDPSSPSYRHFLTVPEFTARFGPAREDYDALTRYLESYGLQAVGGSRDGMDLQVEGPVAAVEAAFSVSLGLYQHPTENRTFYAPDREPTVGLPFPLWHVSGLDNYSIPHPMLARRSSHSNLLRVDRGTSAPRTSIGSGPDGSFLGSDMRAAYYGGSALTGAGQNLGLLEFKGTDLDDLNTYFSNVGQTNTVPITLLSTDGSSTLCDDGCDDTEPTLDMTQAIGMAPGLSSLVLYIGMIDTAMISAMTTNSPLPTTISCSWGWHPADPLAIDPYFEKMAAQGQSFFVASGDEGDWTSTIGWPADDDFVTAAGGTDLETYGAAGAWASETAWSFSGGGVSPNGISIPEWQQIPGVINAANNGSTIYRNGPDVSANADYSFYVCADQAGCTANVLGGTSFAAPMWAAYIALVNQQAALNGNAPIGFINPALYSIGVGSNYAQLFHDITIGNNGTYSAVTGFDLVTGWGSPNGTPLINALANTPANAGISLSAWPSSVSVAEGRSGISTVTTTVSNGFSSPVILTATGQPAGVTVSFSPGTIPPPGSGNSTMTVKVAYTTATGSYPITVTGTGASTTQPTSTVILTVTPTPSFTVSASPGSVSAAQGASGTSTITTAIFGGFNSAIALSASGLPAGATVSFSPASMPAPGAGTSVMTFTVASSTAAGTYPVTVTGTGGAFQCSATVSLTVTAPTFTISATPASLSVVPGGNGTSTITTAVLGGFDWAISLSATGQPAGVTVSFNPATIAAPGPGNSTMTMIAASTAAAGTYTITVTGTGGGITHTSAVTLTVVTVLAIITTSLPNAQTDVPYSATLTATGGTLPYSWVLMSRRLPPGLSLNEQTGQIAGTPSSPTSVALTFSVTDSTWPTPQTASVTLTMNVASSILTITTASLPNGQSGMPYSATLAATGGITPYTWALTARTDLPAGLTLNALTGQISGTPTAAVTNSPLIFSVTDSTTPTPQTAQASVSLTITTVTALTITTTSLPNGQTGVPYSATLMANGGVSPYSWQLVSGTLPAGLALSPQTGQISGTPGATITNTPLTFKVIDSTTPTPQTATVNLTLTIATMTTLTIITTSLPDGQIGVPYSTTLTAAGGTTPYTWALTSGRLPPGLTLDAQTGQISGTPTTRLNTILKFSVTDSTTPTSQAAAVNMTLNIT